MGLGHELGHALENANGTTDTIPSGIRDPDVPSVILTREEVRVRRVENKLRKERSIPLRKI